MNIIKKTRERLGLTQQDFSSLVGCSWLSISRWENHPKPCGLTVERVCRLILSLKRLPRAQDLRESIRIQGGGAAFILLIQQGLKSGPVAVTKEHLP